MHAAGTAAPVLTRRASGVAPLVWRATTPAVRLWALLLCGGLAACSTPPDAGPRVPANVPVNAATPVAAPAPPAPGAGPRARLLLRGAVPGDDQFALVELADSAQCKNPRVLTTGSNNKPPAPTHLAAGQLTTLDFVVLRAGKISCGVRWSFTPDADKTYLAQGLVVGNGCTGRLMDVTDSDRPVPAKGAVLRTGPGQACLPLSQSRPAGEANALIQGGQQDGEAVLNPKATTRDLQGLIRP